MTYAKWILRALVLLMVVGVFHYNLPGHDVVRIVGVETQRMDFGWNRFFFSAPAGGSANTDTRDVRLIETITPDGAEIVYRNQDTGWGWPPYFKFGSANLQTRARDMVSTSEEPRWVVITHYGWRNELISVFPNAVGVRAASGPDERIIPWASIVILALFAALVAWLWWTWVRFRDRWLTPRMEDLEETTEMATGRVTRFWRRLTGRR